PPRRAQERRWVHPTRRGRRSKRFEELHSPVIGEGGVVGRNLDPRELEGGSCEGPGYVTGLVSPTAGDDQAPSELPGEFDEHPVDLGVARRGELELCERIPPVPVDTVLDNQEVGPKLPDQRGKHPAYQRNQGLVSHFRGQRDVHLEPGSIPRPGFGDAAGTGEERAAVLMNVDVE